MTARNHTGNYTILTDAIAIHFRVPASSRMVELRRRGRSYAHTPPPYQLDVTVPVLEKLSQEHISRENIM
jgi:hypothetical protein